MNINFYALLIGILVTTAAYFLMENLNTPLSSSQKKAIGIFSGVLGLIVYYFLSNSPALLASTTERIVTLGIAIVVNLLTLLSKKK